MCKINTNSLFSLGVVLGVFCIGIPHQIRAEIIQTQKNDIGPEYRFSYFPEQSKIKGPLGYLPKDLEGLVSPSAQKALENELYYPSSSFFFPLPEYPKTEDWVLKSTPELVKQITLTPAQQGKTTGLLITVSGSKTNLNGQFSLIQKVSASTSVLQKSASNPIPQPPAPFQLIYSGTSGIQTVSAADLPSSTTQLLWHGSTLPLGTELNGNLWFYAPYTSTVSSDFDSIFVDPASINPSPQIPTRPAFSTLTPQSKEVAIDRTIRHEPALAYERATPIALGTRTVVYRLVQGQSRQTTISLSDAVTTDTIEITVGLASLTTVGNNPEHVANLSILGDTETAQAVWGGRTTAQGILRLNNISNPEEGIPPFLQSFNKSTIIPPAPRDLVLVHSIPLSPIPGFVDIQLLDWVQVNYSAYPRIQNGSANIELSASPSSQPQLLTIGGFPAGTTEAQVLLVDVTTPHSPVQITGASAFADSSGGVALEFEVGPDAAVIVAQLIASLPTPLQLLPTPEIPTPQETLKGIYVCGPELRPALAPLLAHRGAGYVVLDPAAAYAVYNNGQESPEALRSALAAIVEAAPDRVDFPTVLLVGHATFDPSNQMGLKSAPQVPTFIQDSVDTGFTIENSVDFPFGLLLGNDQFQDAQVGRLPVKNAAELTIAIDRIIAFETQVQPLNEVRPALFVTDDDAEILPDAPLWPTLFAPTGTPYQEIIVDGLSNGVPEQMAFRSILSQNPAGVSLVFYTGHGNTTFWGDERIITTQEVPNLATQNKWPIVATFTCLNGNYAVPNATTRSLGEAWAITPNGGALANITPCSVDFYESQKTFSTLFLNLIAEPKSTRPKTIGEALTRTRNAHALAYPDEGITNNLYLLFGDPGSPLLLLSPDSGLEQDWRVLE